MKVLEKIAGIDPIWGGLSALNIVNNANNAMGGSERSTSQKSYASEYSGKGGLIGYAVGAGIGGLNEQRGLRYGLKPSSSSVANSAMMTGLAGSTVGNLAGTLYGGRKHRSDAKNNKLKYRKDGQRYKGQENA